MVDEVEIKNVGGFEGVASEATLLSLLSAIEKQSKTQGAGASAAARAQQLYNRRITEATKETGKFTQAMKDAASGIGRGAKEFVFGGRRVSDFSSAIFGANASITQLTRYLDQNIDTWRSLSSVGASFNNSIFDMISASANSGMELDEFSNLVRRNSETLASFGGTVTQGARNLGEFSRNFRGGVGQQFFEMGFTIEDVNEGLVGFLDLQRRSSSQTLRFDAAQQQSAANYILQLDKLAKITGLQRREIENAMQRQIQDAGVRSQLNRLSGQAQANLRETLAFLDTELQGPLADGLRDLMDGVAQTDLGRALSSQVPGITEFAQRMFAGGATIDEVISELGTNFGPQLERMASGFSKAQLDQMRMSGGVTGAIAEILDSAHQLNRLTDRDVAAARAEQQRRDLITGTLGRFEDAVTRLRRYFVDLFYDAAGASGGFLDAMRSLGDTIMELVTPGSRSFAGFGDKARSFMDTVFGPTGFVTRAIRTFTGWIAGGGMQRALDWLIEKATAVGTFFSEFWEDATNGPGLWATVQDRFNDFLDYMFGERTEDGSRLGGKLEEWFDSIGSAFSGSFLERLTNSALSFLLGEGTTTGNFMERAQEKIMDLLFGPLVDVDPRDQEVSMQRQGGIINGLLTSLGNFWDSVFDDGGHADTAWNWLKTKWNSFVTDVFGEGGAANTAWTWLKTKWDEFVTDVFGEGGAANTAWTWLKTKWDEFVDSIFADGGHADTAWNWLETKWNNFIDSIFGEQEGTFIERVAGALSDAIDKIFGREDVIQSLRNAVSTVFDAAITGISNFWNDPANQNKIDKFFEDMTAMFQRVVDAIVTAIQGAIRGATGSSATSIGQGGSSTAALGESVAQGDISGAAANAGRALFGFGTIDRDQFLSEAQGGVVNSINAWLGDALGMGVDDWFRGHLRSVRGQHPEWTDAQVRDEVQRGLEQYISTNYSDPTELETMNRYMRESLIPTLRETSFAEGTNGFQNFGQGTLSMLHGSEAVVPRNSEAGELLQAFYDRQSQPSVATGTQSMSNDKLDQLNNTMMQVASLLSQALGVQTRTMREVRAGGSDYFRSIGR